MTTAQKIVIIAWALLIVVVFWVPAAKATPLKGTATYGKVCTSTLTGAETCDVYLTPSIDHVTFYYPLLHDLNTASKGDVYRFHLAGYGGRVDTLVQIVTTLQTTKARTIAIVEGPVYSAHAFLSVSMDEIVLKKGALLMFHHSSALNSGNKYCKDDKGKLDRGQDAEKKCRDYINTHLKNFEALIVPVLRPILTKQELKDVLEGHDVYVSGVTLKERLGKN